MAQLDRGPAETLLGLLPSDVEYADVRLVMRRHEGLVVENEHVDQLLQSESLGIGLRVLIGGQWGFAATDEVDRSALDRLVRVAAVQARLADGPAHRLAPVQPVQAVWASPMERDPFLVPLDEKVVLLMEATREMRRAGRLVRSAQASVDAFREHKVFLSTEGSSIEQTITEAGGGLMAIASDGDDVQRRSFPQSVPRAIRGQRGDFRTAGFEHVEALDLPGAGARVGAEAVQLLTADECAPTETTLIIGAAQMAQVIHETAGHPAELDRVLGSEVSLAGGSFLQPELRRELRYGSDLVTIVADATIQGGLGSFAYDDEGIAAQRRTIVEEGTFVGYLSSRSSAFELGEESSGAARADGWNRVPLVRMTNVSLEPGDTPFEDMIASTPTGVLVDMNRSLSIDAQRRSFSFGAEIAWEIQAGRVGRMLKNVSFAGDTLALWRSCDAVADRSSFRLWGIPSCNKGDPLQVAHIGHGTVPARFQRVRVGSRR